MKYIDLTHKIENNMPVYPGTASLEMIPANTIEKDGFREKIISFCSHTGTHMDAPSHMLQQGNNLDDYDCSKFIGKALLLSIEEEKNIRDYADQLEKVDFVFFKTGWSKYWGKAKYFENYPCISLETTDYLVGFDLKGVGFDAISIDPIDSKFENHYRVFENDMVIIENLTNLDQINEEIFELMVLPLNIKEADGSPIRAIAKVK
jgi:kynurenine formamidase